MAMTCFDDPKDVLGSDTCIASLSKDVRGETVLQSSTRHVCKKTECLSLRTSALLKAEIMSNVPCDGPLAQLLSGSITVRVFTTAYEKDGLGRGVHAGDFQWISSKGDEIDGRMSGITNAGLVRAKPFALAVEKCVSEGILVGRLCGRVVKSKNANLKDAQVLATYRFRTTATDKGESGPLIGTLEGVVVTPC